MTIDQIASSLDLGYKKVYNVIAKHYTVEQRQERKSRTYANSKRGDKNPMKDVTREDHPKWKGGVVPDGNGYLMVLKPDWYEGRKGSNYVFQHTIVMCEALGLKKLPRGWVVHHIDKDKTNNDINNLTLLTNGAHMRLHSRERATTSRKT